MSGIKIKEIKQNSELNLLSGTEATEIVGGLVDLDINVSVPTQININNTVQTALNGSNFNTSDLGNNLGSLQV